MTVRALALGAKSTYALVQYGGSTDPHVQSGVYGWGSNASSALANGCSSGAGIPLTNGGLPSGGSTQRAVVVLSTPGKVIQQLTAGDEGGCVLMADGSVMCWGTIATSPATIYSSPTTIAGLPSIASIAQGSSHACAIDRSGKVWCWGDNDKGQLGVTGPGRVTPVAVDMSKAASVDGFSAPVAPFLVVAAAAKTSCALDSGYNIWCWGDNERGGLGNGAAVLYPQNGYQASFSAAPQQVVPPSADGFMPPLPQTPHALVGGGAGTFCAIGVDSQLWTCWGANDAGQAGLGWAEDLPAPGPMIGGVADAPFIALGGSSACIGGVLPGSQIVSSPACYGSEQYGQVGNGVVASADAFSPVVVAGLPPVDPADTNGLPMDLAVGAAFACTHEASRVICWGEGDGFGAAPGSANSSPTILPW